MSLGTPTLAFAREYLFGRRCLLLELLARGNRVTGNVVDVVHLGKYGIDRRVMESVSLMDFATTHSTL